MFGVDLAHQAQLIGTSPSASVPGDRDGPATKSPKNFRPLTEIAEFLLAVFANRLEHVVAQTVRPVDDGKQRLVDQSLDRVGYVVHAVPLGDRSRRRQRETCRESAQSS